MLCCGAQERKSETLSVLFQGTGACKDCDGQTWSYGHPITDNRRLKYFLAVALSKYSIISYGAGYCTEQWESMDNKTITSLVFKEFIVH
jgi:hypothetical protein